jgi:hypothetical protein
MDVKDATESINAHIKRVNDDLKNFSHERAQEVAGVRAELLQLQQHVVKMQNEGGGFSAVGGFGPSLGQQVEQEFQANSEMYRKAGRVALEVQASITSAPGGGHGSLDAPAAPAQNATQLVGMLKPEDIAGLATLHYARRTGVTGAAGVQAGEGAAKPTSEPVFTAVAQNAITISGVATLTEQALRTTGGLKRAVDAHLTKSVRDAADLVLLEGTDEAAWPFDGLIALAEPFTAVDAESLVDAVLAGRLFMATSGFNPAVAVMNSSDYLGAVTAKGEDGHYLAGGLSGTLALQLVGLRVALSNAIPSGQALLLDTAFVGMLRSPAVRISVGHINDDFSRNLVRVRGEIDMIPYLNDFEAALLVEFEAASSS